MPISPFYFFYRNSIELSDYQSLDKIPELSKDNLRLIFKSLLDDPYRGLKNLTQIRLVCKKWNEAVDELYHYANENRNLWLLALRRITKLPEDIQSNEYERLFSFSNSKQEIEKIIEALFCPKDNTIGSRWIRNGCHNKIIKGHKRQLIQELLKLNKKDADYFY